MNPDSIAKLSLEQRKEIIGWLAAHIETAPAPFRPLLESILDQLTAAQISKKDFNAHSRKLARVLGLVPSSERRRSSGNPLAGLKTSSRRRPKNKWERLKEEPDKSDALAQYHQALVGSHIDKRDKLDERLRGMVDESDTTQGQEIDFDTPVEEIEISEERRAQISQESKELVRRLELGDGEADPALRSATESLMNASVVSTDEDQVLLEAELPEDVSEEDVVKTMTDTRVRYDFSVAVTRVELDVEKKVVKTKDGKRRVISASTSEYGPPRYAVTWNALATLAVLIAQFAMPMNRLATMLTTAVKRFTASSLSRMAHYVAERLVPIYLELFDHLADSEVLAGDDTSCRVVEVSSYFSKPLKKGKERRPAPWAPYRTSEDAEECYAFYLKMRDDLFKKREEGERAAIKAHAPRPSLSLLVGRELTFESQKRHGQGPKQSLNTTVLTGRHVADDPRSLVVFYRSHLGSLGNLLEMLLRRRKPSARKVNVQSDLSTTNLVTDPELTSRFEIELFGCMSHARRPFALYEDQDPIETPSILHFFKGLVLHEHLLDRHGRNRENVLAVRGTDCLKMWNLIKESATRIAKKWSKATPLGAGARYIIKHFKRLTAYLSDPRLELTNNLRERMLRTEKLIEKSSMFRKTVEGRAVLDILRTIIQTAVAAEVPVQEYLVDVLKTDPDEIAEHPERYTPRAWAARNLDDQREDVEAPAA
ncbi:transposase [Myxococcota bacterium]